MNRVLCTMPGKFGDILWALPTVRALAETYGTRVDLCLSGKYGSIAELIRQQDYIGEVLVDAGWEVRDTAPMTPRLPNLAAWTWPQDFQQYDRIVHLGYDGWPTAPLPYDIWSRSPVGTQPLDLARPWIHLEQEPAFRIQVGVGFTDEWFELKFGVLSLLAPDMDQPAACCSMGSRWDIESDSGRATNDFFSVHAQDWLEVAQNLAHASIFFGCCSALHVLAVALGKPCVIMEPNPHRHHDIFYPLGKTGRVHLVTGNDGLPTFDARHCADAIREALR